MKDGFIDHVALVATSDGRNVVHHRPVHFMLDGKLFRIPIGSESDGLSDPCIFWPVLAPFGKRHWLSANAHDAGYRRTLEVQENGQWRKVTHREYWDDRMILKLLISQGTSKVMAYIIYYALRAFGWKAFRDDRQKESPAVTPGVES